MSNLNLNAFRISGYLEDINTLKASIQSALYLTNTPTRDITGYRIDECGQLVFCTESSKKSTAYPFPPSSHTIAEHILDYIMHIDENDLTKFGEELSGYEEDYDIGYELFTNDYRSDYHRIIDFDASDVFAVRPIIIESGK